MAASSIRIPLLLSLTVLMPAASPERSGREYPAYDFQVVLETTAGTIVLDVFPEAAPHHVEAFLSRIREGFYEGTTIHRAVPMAIIQGGDPLTRDPSRRSEYGTGGLHELSREPNELSHLRGTVSAVLVPGRPDSAGSQFFVCVTDQPHLDGEFTAFGRVVEGMEVVEAMSKMETDEAELLEERVEIVSTSLRERPPPEVVPFLDTPVAELRGYRAVIETPLGEIEMEFFPEKAPMHVRQFLRFARLELYDGTDFHRAVPGFVIQGGNLSSREPPVPERYRELLRTLPPEVSAHEHGPGSVSMARGEDPDSAMDSFFIVLSRQPHLDERYTAFGRVVRGMETVEAIAALETDEERPLEPVRMTVRVLTP